MLNRLVKPYKRWKRRSKIRRETPEIWLIEERKVGYIQIPKVATRTIQECLAKCYASLNNESIPDILDKNEVREIEDKTAYHLSQKKISALTNEYFLFCFVRNPYDRLYSAYKNKVVEPVHSGAKNILENHGVELGMGFKEFVDIVVSIPDRDIDRHLRSQSWFLTYEGRILPRYIGKLETFDADWSKLNSRFNLGMVRHKNSTASLSATDFASQYSTELEEKVFNRYKEDFEFFGYERLCLKN